MARKRVNEEQAVNNTTEPVTNLSESNTENNPGSVITPKYGIEPTINNPGNAIPDRPESKKEEKKETDIKESKKEDKTKANKKNPTGKNKNRISKEKRILDLLGDHLFVLKDTELHKTKDGETFNCVCNHKGKYFYNVEDEDGRVIQVGSTCLTKYFGISVPKKRVSKK